MANGKIVKYKKSFIVTIEGKTDTKYPDEPPLYLQIFTRHLHELVRMMDNETKWNSVKIEEIDNVSK